MTTVLDFVKDMMLQVSRSYVDDMVEETSEKVNAKVDFMVKRAAAMLRDVLPPMIYSSLFYGVGMLIVILGLSSYLDTLVGVEGAGYMIGGVVLIFLGLYYKMQFEKALDRISPPKI